MPITLASLRDSPNLLRRRHFLKTAALGAAALAMGSRHENPPAHEPESRSWALLSDTHIHASVYEQHQGSNMASNLLGVLGDVIKVRPSVALINGDCARLDGQRSDYETLLSLLDPLRRAGVPIHATLGNHDSRENFTAVLGTTGEKLTRIDRGGVADKYCAAFEQDGHRWLLLDSLEDVNKTPGFLGAAQIEWVARELDAAPAKPTLMFLHHNLGDSTLKDQEDLMKVLRPRRQVKAVFFGHTHAWRRFVDAGIHLVNLPAVGYAFAAGEPLGWTRATPRSGGLVLELRALEGKHPHHGQPMFLPYRTDAETAKPI